MVQGIQRVRLCPAEELPGKVVVCPLAADCQGRDEKYGRRGRLCEGSEHSVPAALAVSPLQICMAAPAGLRATQYAFWVLRLMQNCRKQHDEVRIDLPLKTDDSMHSPLPSRLLPCHWPAVLRSPPVVS